MIKVSSKELSFLTPDHFQKDDSYQKRIESFLTNQGIQVSINHNDKAILKEFALDYWKHHSHGFLTEAAWLSAYCRHLKIELILPQ